MAAGGRARIVKTSGGGGLGFGNGGRGFGGGGGWGLGGGGGEGGRGLHGSETSAWVGKQETGGSGQASEERSGHPGGRSWADDLVRKQSCGPPLSHPVHLGGGGEGGRGLGGGGEGGRGLGGGGEGGGGGLRRRTGGLGLRGGGGLVGRGGGGRDLGGGGRGRGGGGDGRGLGGGDGGRGRGGGGEGGRGLQPEENAAAAEGGGGGSDAVPWAGRHGQPHIQRQRFNSLLAVKQTSQLQTEQNKNTSFPAR